MSSTAAISTLSRRVILKAASLVGASVTLDTASPSSLTHDPVFAAIKHSRAAAAELSRWAFVDDEIEVQQLGYTVTPADRMAFERAEAAEIAAAHVIANTSPTTMAGLRAAIAWTLEYDRWCLPEATEELLTTLLRSPLLKSEKGAIGV